MTGTRCYGGSVLEVALIKRDKYILSFLENGY